MAIFQVFKFPVVSKWKNQFELVHTSWCTLVRNYWFEKEAWAHKITIFPPFLAKLTFNTTWLKISTYQPLKLCNNVWSWCKDGWDTCGLFQGKWLQKCLPIDLHWIRNYGNMRVSPKSLKFLQGVMAWCLIKLSLVLWKGFNKSLITMRVTLHTTQNNVPCKGMKQVTFFLIWLVGINCQSVNSVCQRNKHLFTSVSLID